MQSSQPSSLPHVSTSSLINSGGNSSRGKARDSEIKTGAIANWYGSNRMLAESVGRELRGCRMVNVAFAGGMSELPHIDAKMLVNDLHPHLINLARVVKDDALCEKLESRLNRFAFMEEFLREAQARCVERENKIGDGRLFGPEDPAAPKPDIDWAEDYFVATWMGRGAGSGQGNEFSGGFSFRFTASGGGSSTRFRSATQSLRPWQRLFSKQCEFCRLDVFDFLDKCHDTDNVKLGGPVGIYLDPPFPGPGDLYKFRFTEAQHRRMANRLAEFRLSRVVCRFYDHPLIHELYPESRWTWVRQIGRKQSNDTADELLLINVPSLSKAAA